MADSAPLSFINVKSGLFENPVDDETLPGVAELRIHDKKYDECCIWHVSSDDDEQTSWIIKFGSLPDRMYNGFMFILSLVELLFLPLVISFDAVYPLNRVYEVWLFDGLYQLFFLTGVILQFFNAFIDRKTMSEIVELSIIRRNVLRRTTFYLDIVSLLCVPCLYTDSFLRFFAYFRMLRCWRLKSDRLRTTLLTEGSSWMSDLSGILIFVYTCVHLFACAWFKAKVHSPYGYGHEWSAWNGWSQDVFNDKEVDEGSFSLVIEPGDRYDLIFCYMHALRDGTCMIVTWGGPNALSPVELCAVTILGPLSSCIMAYVYGYVVAVLGRLTAIEDRYSETMSLLNAACEDMELPQELRIRICRYHTYLVAHHMDTDARMLFEELSPNILSEARVFRMRNIIRSADVFQGLTPRLILILVSTCTEHLFSPGDLVVRKGEIADCMYIVLKGALAVLIDDEASLLVKKIYDHEMFGEVCFLSRHQPRMGWIRAETFSVLSRFDRDRFDEVLEDHQDIKDNICDAIRQSMLKYRTQDLRASGLKATEVVTADAAMHSKVEDDEEDNERTPLMTNRSDSRPVLTMSARNKRDSQRESVRLSTIGLNSAAAESIQTVSGYTFRDVLADNLKSSASRKNTRMSTIGPRAVSGGPSLRRTVSAARQTIKLFEMPDMTKILDMTKNEDDVWTDIPASPLESPGPSSPNGPRSSLKASCKLQPADENLNGEHLLRLRIGLEMQKDALRALQLQDGAVLPELGCVMHRECQDIASQLDSVESSMRRIEGLFGLHSGN